MLPPMVITVATSVGSTFMTEREKGGDHELFLIGRGGGGPSVCPGADPGGVVVGGGHRPMLQRV